jgi:hypothetical protein
VRPALGGSCRGVLGKYVAGRPAARRHSSFLLEGAKLGWPARAGRILLLFVSTNQLGFLGLPDLVTVCDIPAQGLIGSIRILIPTSCNFFSGSSSLKTRKLSVLGLEQWVTDREVLPECA